MEMLLGLPICRCCEKTQFLFSQGHLPVSYGGQLYV